MRVYGMAVPGGKKSREVREDEAVTYLGIGKSVREAEQLTNIPHKTIARRAKERGVNKGDLTQLIQEKAQVDAKLSSMKYDSRKIIEREALIKQQHIEFFNKAAMQNVREAMATECKDQYEHKARADTISKGKEVVIGKAPDTAIQINNSIRLEDLLADL
jgi:transposase